jgi:large subunit ribosomal protein L19
LAKIHIGGNDRMRVTFFMQKKVIEFNLKQRTKKFPDLRPGDVVKVHRKIAEKDKEIAQVFEGMIIAVKGSQSSSPTITVRKVAHGVGVELILPLYSPLVDKIEVVKRAKIRRAKLYYLRDISLKSTKMKYTDTKGKSIIEEVAEEIKIEE